MMVVIPLVIFPIIFMGRKVRALSQDSQDRIADVGALISEVLRGIKVVQAFVAEDREAARFARSVEAVFATAKRRIRMRAFMTAIVITLVSVSYTHLDVYKRQPLGQAIPSAGPFSSTGAWAEAALACPDQPWHAETLRGRRRM